MQPFRAPRPVQEKSRLELGMGIIDKGIPVAKDKDQTQIHDSPNKTVSERVISDSEEPTELGLVWERRSVSEHVVCDSEEPTELGLVWERSDMPVDKVGPKKNDGNEIPNPWWPADEENNAKPSEAPSPHLSDFEDYLAQVEARQNVVAIAQGNLSTRHSVPVLSTC